MTPEELDEARAREAVRRFGEPGDKYELANERELAAIAARLAREGWTPPEPKPVDPDLLAFREFAVRTGIGHLPSSAMAEKLDNGREAKAYLAGARMAREQARPLAQYLQDRADRDDAEADRILAKYRGEA